MPSSAAARSISALLLRKFPPTATRRSQKAPFIAPSVRLMQRQVCTQARLFSARPLTVYLRERVTPRDPGDLAKQPLSATRAKAAMPSKGPSPIVLNCN